MKQHPKATNRNIYSQFIGAIKNKNMKGGL